MTSEKPTVPPGTPSIEGADEPGGTAARRTARQDREAAALRANLARRKAQQRSRATVDTPQPSDEPDMP